jgi:prepilin signal peptidase PulO-like enzyme (type II secretory pathway)
LGFSVLFLFGAAIGSFLNVVSLRYKPGKEIFSEDVAVGRSRCLHCRKTLKWHELVPIFSFIIQKGKCLHCKQKLLWQYPLIEILSGLVFIFIPLSLNATLFSSRVIVWIIIFLIFILIALIDFKNYIIPDQLSISLAILGLFLINIKERVGEFGMFNGSFLGHYAALFGLRENIWINHFFAALLGMSFFGLIILLSRGRAMGWGDFKLIGPLGFIFGWPDILMVIFFAFITGSIFVIPLLISRHKKMKDVVPFGPFLIVASALTFFWGYKIIDGYFSLFNL